jgi:hypothetical protein
MAHIYIAGTDQTTEDGDSLAGEKEMTTPTVEMRAATATALGSAAVRAKLLADQEDQDIENLFSTVVDTQVSCSREFACYICSVNFWKKHDYENVF